MAAVRERDPKNEAYYRHELREAEKELAKAPKPGRLVRKKLGTMRRARWLWDGRIPRGELTLIAGREGTGKSTIAFDLAASVSTGKLPGEHFGTPQAVLIAATEDSFEHTITPRLVAAGADLDYIEKVEGVESGALTLPIDIFSLEQLATEAGAALLIMDPLISRLGELDTHRDADVRQALEPLVEIAQKTGMSVLGLIHHNKTGTTDPLTAIMGSRAFAAVARSVLTASVDPDDESRNYRLLAHAKSSLGRQMATLSYTIDELQVGDDDGPITGSKIEWKGEDDRSAYEIAGAGVEKRTPKKESTESWLEGFLREKGPTIASDVKIAGRLRLEVSDSTIERAATQIGVVKARAAEFPSPVTWSLPTK